MLSCSDVEQVVLLLVPEYSGEQVKEVVSSQVFIGQNSPSLKFPKKPQTKSGVTDSCQTWAKVLCQQ